MTLVLIEGWDVYSSSSDCTRRGWSSPFDGSQQSIQTGRVAAGSFSKCYQINQSSGQMNTFKTLPSTYATVILGFAYAPSDSNSHAIYYVQTAGGAAVCAIGQNSSGQLFLANAAGSTVATGTTIVGGAGGVWYYIELKVTASTTGAYELRIFGVTEFSGTANFGSTNIGRVGIGSISSAGYLAKWDDMYVADTTGSWANDFIGDVAVETTVPNADGATNAWTQNSGGNHFSRVNEGPAPDSDTSYESDSTPGDYDLFAFPALTASSGTVFGVQQSITTRKDDVAAHTICPAIRQSGTTYDGATMAALSTSYVTMSAIAAADPVGSQWTISSVNGDQFGYKTVT